MCVAHKTHHLHYHHKMTLFLAFLRLAYYVGNVAIKRIENASSIFFYSFVNFFSFVSVNFNSTVYVWWGERFFPFRRESKYVAQMQLYYHVKGIVQENKRFRNGNRMRRKKKWQKRRMMLEWNEMNILHVEYTVGEMLRTFEIHNGF